MRRRRPATESTARSGGDEAATARTTARTDATTVPVAKPGIDEGRFGAPPAFCFFSGLPMLCDDGRNFTGM